MLSRPIVVIVTVLHFAGCATIINGTTQKVSVGSDPPGVDVYVGGDKVGTTPCDLTLKRKEHHLLTISKDGYQTEQVNIIRVVSGAVAGNIIAGGLIGWAVDAGSGGQYRLVPDAVTVQMRTHGSREAVRASSTSSPVDRLRDLHRLHNDGLVTDDEYEAMRDLIISEWQGR